MARRRHHQRVASASSSSSASTSPERGVDDDNDSFMLQGNDSQSSLGVENGAELSQDDAMRREYEERCRVSPVARLPAELLISIFSRLTSPRDLQMCMLVSKEWARNCVGLLWHRPAMSKWDSIHSVVQSIRKSKKFFAYQDLVKRLNMSTLANQVSDGTLLGMVECKRIERLTLTNCCKLTDLSLQPLVDMNKSLLALDVTGLDQLTDRTLESVADNCLRLQGLNVTGCKKLTDASIVAIARNCRHLKRLKFNNCVQLTDTAIMTIAANSTHLLEIDLYGLHNLESPAVTALLTSCPHLREMRLAHCPKITDAAFLDIPNDPDRPRQFEALRILDLTDCGELGDKGVNKIIQTCPRLRNLILAKCRLITDAAVEAITKLGKNLHYIHLGHCARITDVSVKALAKFCNRIRYIDLACCSNLTDESVVELAGLPKLKRIGLVKCAGITDESIRHLAHGDSGSVRRPSGSNVLERVHLSYCTLLTVDVSSARAQFAITRLTLLQGIYTLLEHCPKLTHLSLTGVQAFLQEDLLAFCRDAPPEFNEHQRDVFCVFSGNGVSRLREYLKEQHAARDASITATPSAIAESEVGIDLDVEEQSPDSNGSNTPVINVNVHSNFPHGSTPIARGPSPPVPLPHGPGFQNHMRPAGHPHLSQSAPATTGGAPWAGGSTPVIINTAGGAQHVTGMMSATILDDEHDVDGDDAFGEGSELLE